MAGWVLPDLGPLSPPPHNNSLSLCVGLSPDSSKDSHLVVVPFSPLTHGRTHSSPVEPTWLSSVVHAHGSAGCSGPLPHSSCFHQNIKSEFHIESSAWDIGLNPLASFFSLPFFFAHGAETRQALRHWAVSPVYHFTLPASTILSSFSLHLLRQSQGWTFPWQLQKEEKYLLQTCLSLLSSGRGCGDCRLAWSLQGDLAISAVHWMGPQLHSAGVAFKIQSQASVLQIKINM